ncbi:MAG: DUF881 domain-containing protein [Mycobacteriales bacterium]
MPPTETPPRSPFGGILSTSLLDDIWANALDPGYDESTRARREAGTAPRRSARGLAVTLLLALVLGAAAAAAASQVHRSLTDSRGTKPALVRQVEQEQQTAAALSSQETRLRDQLVAARGRQLTATAAGDRLSAEIQSEQDAVAATPVTGPGVTVRVSDAHDAQPGTADVGLVTDGDLRDLVNALWAAGAEAIAVNGFRLGPATAIRTAGEAILVDFRPVTSPYVVSVIGPQNALQTGLAASAAGQRLQVLHSAYGLGVAVHTAGTLHLAGATTTELRYARPLRPGGTS